VTDDRHDEIAARLRQEGAARAPERLCADVMLQVRAEPRPRRIRPRRSYWRPLGSLAAAASAHMSQHAAARFLVTSFHSAPSQLAVDAYFISEYAAPVLMGFALWRSRSVPRWLAVLFTAGLEIAETQGSGGPKVVLFMLPFAVAMVLLAARIWQAAARLATQLSDTAPPPSAAPPDLATTPLRTGPGN